MRKFARSALVAAMIPAALLLAPMAASITPKAGTEWLVHGGTDSEQRFSPLDQINSATVSKLGLAWSFEFTSSRGQEATPIMVDGVLYVSTAWSRVHAVDAKTGKELWSYDPQVAGRKAFDACCDVVNRGVAVSGGKVFLGALDGRLIALDAKTGKVAWEQQTTDPAKPYTITGAPRVFNGKVVIGNGGAEYGVRGYVTAYDQATGKQLWRFYTVPGDPKAGPDGAASDPVMAKATATWAGKWYDYGGGGTVWDSIVYDPELNQLYLGVGNGSPWNHKIRSDGKGDNLFLSSVVALDADTGAYKWHYQETPGESWDFTATQPIMLATLKIDGQDRKVLMQAPKNGFFYVVDRTSGKLISAKNFVPQNWATGVDLTTGRPIENPAARYPDGKPFAMYPSALGGHSWHSMAFSPKTGLVYLPTYQFVMVYGDDPDFHFTPGIWNNAISTKLQVAPDDPKELATGTASFAGRLVAWDPVAQKQVWSVQHASLQNGGVLATAGGLVFEGTGAANFEARDATDGKLLWSYPVTDGIIAAPISYELGGVQYVAIVAGYGGGFGLGEGAPKPTARPNGRLIVFKLGGKAKLPDVKLTTAPLNPTDEAFSAAQVDNGRQLFTKHCYRCHGAGAQSAGVLPDLRRSAALSDSALWKAILIDGALEPAGMASFRDWLKPDQAEEIRAYIALKAKIAAQQPAP
jgi:quinohemoprotein ethanol dehydrogenase